MSSSLTYLITGASRGIGKGFAATLLQRPNTTVVAAVRDVTKYTPTLESLPKRSGSKLIIVKLDSSCESDPKNAVAQLQSEHGITSLDVVIANAGVGHSITTVAKTATETIHDHFNVNTIGPILLFQAARPLLQASKSGNPIFLAISTIAGSIGIQPSVADWPPIFSPYGASKAALNWFVVRMHIEELWLTSYVVHPGLVLTDMVAHVEGLVDVNALGGVSVEKSVEGMLSMLDKADRKIGGTFQCFDGTTLPW